jgi:hypothetical protein
MTLLNFNEQYINSFDYFIGPIIQNRIIVQQKEMILIEYAY